jgi:hypothetical protein
MIFETDEKKYFSTYPPPTLIHLSHRFTRASKSTTEKSQSLTHLVGPHLRLSDVLERISRPNCEPLYATNTSHRKQNTIVIAILCIVSFC